MYVDLFFLKEIMRSRWFKSLLGFQNNTNKQGCQGGVQMIEKLFKCESWTPKNQRNANNLLSHWVTGNAAPGQGCVDVHM